ncbi:hypothetical protein [Streptomyces zaehneri]|uniref:hypothetical protein n=1 Tax=Streptomyces zaehneri TaxID=3051180 RepID=UPI0028D25F16|nr:hypothetical protein [Streptomyces sp. DSM 40713]
MTWPTALPGAALRILRVVRGAAGRRVVQLALLVGGLFALGFLCGEQAHAAGGPSAPALSAPALSAPALPQVPSVPALSAPALPPVPSVPALSAPALPQVPSVPAGVTDQVVGLSSVPAGGDVVVAAVGEQRGRLSAQVSPPPVSSSPRLPIAPARPELPDPSELAKLPKLPVLADLPKLPDVSGPTYLPSLPTLPALPDLPDLPDLPALPALPALSDLPALPSVPVRTLPVPVVEVPGQGSRGTPSPDGHGLGLGDRKAVGAVPVPVTAKVTAADTAADVAVDAETASYGPVSTDGGGSVDAGHGVASARTGQAPAYAPGPVRRGPADDRDGVLSCGASALDGGASRHGDTHAVTLSHRIPLRLVPGSAARSEAAGTRDGHRNIPVFPG